MQSMLKIGKNKTHTCLQGANSLGKQSKNKYNIGSVNKSVMMYMC